MSENCPHCPRLRTAMRAASDELHASFGKGSREVNGAAGRARKILERALEETGAGTATNNGPRRGGRKSEEAKMATGPARGYVRLDNGKWAVQIPDPESRWGFYLATSATGDDSDTFDGGFGLADNQEWTLVPESKVPKGVKDRLGWLLDD